MQNTSQLKRTWILVLAVLLLFIVFSYFISSPKPKEYPQYVSESPSPTGTKALYTYLEKSSRWNYSPLQLVSQDYQLLIMVEPYFFPEQEEMDAYMSFMEEGNTILLFQTNPEGMFNIQTNYVQQEIEENETIDYKNRQFTADMTSLVRLETLEKDTVLLSDQAGVIAFKRPLGDGNLIVANSPSWLMNDSILKNDHLQLVLSLIDEANPDGATVLFDEYIHGAENAATLDTIYPKWMLVFAVQAIIFMTLLLWHQGKRFGPIHTVREETVRFSDERIRALAAWYQRRKLYHDSLSIQADYLKTLLFENYGISYQKDWIDITDQLERKLNQIPGREIQSFTSGLTDVLMKKSITKQEYLLWSKKIDKVRKEVDEDERRTNILTRKI